MYIDDEPLNLELCSSILNDAFSDYKILLAESGAEGLNITKKEFPDAILLDIVMPDLDGFEVCRKLKTDPLTMHIPVIMVSAKGEDTQVRIKALDVGADSFITKPFNRLEFIGIVGVMLSSHHDREELKKRNVDLDKYIEEQTTEKSALEDRYGQISSYDEHFLWEIDIDGVLVFIGIGVKDLLGLNPDNLLGKDIRKMSFFPELHYKDSFKDLECELTTSSGNIVYLAVSGFPIFNKQNILNGYRGISHNITPYKRMQLELENKMEEISLYRKRVFAMGNALAKTEERERRRISEYLHDELGATLAIANMRLTSISDYSKQKEVRDTINETIGLLGKAITNSRSVIYELSPPILYELGLIAALRLKLEQIEKEGHLKSTFKVEHNFAEIDQDFQVFIYRIISELLLNVLKHAKASELELAISIVKNQLLIFVKDNGKGMNVDYLMRHNKKLSFGLRNMVERVESLGGIINVESEAGEYTFISVRIPLLQS